ncbi:hypothetical protein [Microvirga zambiensis]|uniref:hypothetical protein n=1 Tax=Microvirga zambiensis TaxID=1402137 RepID=UPI00191D8846|nr:hypothetical protein [Microvirga zambiensis]
MREAFPKPLLSERVAVLLHPSMVPVIDVFRSLNSLDDHYDLALLDAPEQALSQYTTPETARAIVSDMLLLAFSLTRQRDRAFSHRPLGSRHSSLDEYCLLALIGSSRNPVSDVALEAAAELDVVSLDAMGPLAGDLVRQIDLGTIVFQQPILSDFRAIMNRGMPEEVLIEPALTKAEFNFRI